MIKYSLYFAVILLLFRCSEATPVPISEVHEVRNIGELSTTEYTVGKIVKLDDTAEEWYKFGDRKLLIHCKAKIKAGVNLSKLKDDDIKVSGTSIEITLPPAQVTLFSMDPNLMRTEMESVTGLRSNFTQKEKNAFLIQGEESIKKDILETGILKDANNNAEAFLIDFYSQMGFEKVSVKRTGQKDEK